MAKKSKLTQCATVAIFAAAAIFLCGCWQAAATRAAKKRKSETGYVIGTIEKESGVEDPLGRKQKSVDF